MGDRKEVCSPVQERLTKALTNEGKGLLPLWGWGFKAGSTRSGYSSQTTLPGGGVVQGGF